MTYNIKDRLNANLKELLFIRMRNQTTELIPNMEADISVRKKIWNTLSESLSTRRYERLYRRSERLTYDTP